VSILVKGLPCFSAAATESVRHPATAGGPRPLAGIDQQRISPPDGGHANSVGVAAPPTVDDVDIKRF